MNDVALHTFLNSWQHSFSEVLSQIAGSAVHVAERDASGLPEGDLCFLVTAGGGLRGEMDLRFSVRDALALVGLFLGDPQAGNEVSAEHREALEELLRQIAGVTATALKPKWGEVQLRVEAGAKPSWTAAAAGRFASAETGACAFAVGWELSAALLAALRPSVPAANSHARSEPQLQLVKDVTLNVTLRFGGRQMLLRELLELCTGSVIELDRQVDEPAELLLEGRLIAHGEVVVVDGNYGLRVLDVMTAGAA